MISWGGQMPKDAASFTYHLVVKWKSGKEEHWKFKKVKFRSSALRAIKKNPNYKDHKAWDSID